jgi:magnesium-transporting ATPase (P-type)
MSDKGEDKKHKSKEDLDKEELDKRAQNAIEEARMVLPGIQALFGFQLVAVFNQRFPQIPMQQQMLHYAALLLIAVAIGLIMAPAAYHRIVEEHSVSRFFIRLASVMIATSMLPLLTAISFEIYILGHLVLDNDQASFWIAIATATFLATLWYVFPFIVRLIVGRRPAKN